MQKSQKIKLAIVLLFSLTLVFGFNCSQSKYFDNARQQSDQVRLTILYPELGSIQALMKLKDIGFFQVENLVVVGVYHEKERTNYQASIDFARKNKLEWLKFHRLNDEIDKDVLFQNNELTDDFENIFNKSDGIIFFGGADIPPYIYGEKTNLLTEIETPYRSFLETSFIFHLLGGNQDSTFVPLLTSNFEFPILGICLGCQSLNVGTGGTLIQDIWSEIYGKKTLEEVISLDKDQWHTNPFRRLFPEKNLISYNMHPIKLLHPGKFVTELGFIEAANPFVVSAHHQTPGRLGKGMRIIAISLDGKVVESLDHEIYPNVLGVQFHPEFPILYDRTRAFRFLPGDEKAVSLLDILEHNPQSYEFHQKIWKWFGEKLTTYHNSKNREFK
jgi:putative glutamine amidotransferase